MHLLNAEAACCSEIWTLIVTHVQSFTHVGNFEANPTSFVLGSEANL